MSLHRNFLHCPWELILKCKLYQIITAIECLILHLILVFVKKWQYYFNNGHSYRLNVSSPKFTFWNSSHPICNDNKRWGLWEITSEQCHEYKLLMNEMCVLIRAMRELLPFSATGRSWQSITWKKLTILAPWSQISSFQNCKKQISVS